MNLSVIIPLYNNYDTITETVAVIKENIGNDPACKIVFIDDGSTDDSISLLKELKKNENRITILQLDKNYGPLTAIYAGLKFSAAEYTILISADLQEERDLIRKFINSSQRYPKADLIIGYREKNADYFIFKIFSRLFYRLIKMKIPEMPLNGFDTICIRKDLKENFLSGFSSSMFGQLELVRLSANIIPIPYQRQKSATKHFHLKSILFKIKYFYNGLKLVYFRKAIPVKIDPPVYKVRNLIE